MTDLPTCARFSYPAEGFPILEIDHPACKAKVALHGAHVMEWTPAGECPVLYLSPNSVFAEGKAIRGGIPICWPWFGPHPVDTSKPAHGLVRNTLWQLISCQDHGASVEIRLEIHANNSTRKLWPYEFHLIAEIRLGAELHLSLISHNTGTVPYSETAALHTYLAVREVSEIEILGLDDTEFLEKAGGQSVPGHQAGPVKIVGEVDRIYASSSEVVLRDGNRSLEVHKHGSASTVIWNPGEKKAATMSDLPPGDFQRFVCIETANAPGAEVMVHPGETHTLRARICLIV